MKQLSTALMILSLLSGCTAELQKEEAHLPGANTVAAASLNTQIEKFNANKRSGTFPIDQRVSQIDFDRKADKATCLDADGEPFLVLNREPDGRFKGIVEVEYHLLGGAGSGHILAEFYLEKGMF